MKVDSVIMAGINLRRTDRQHVEGGEGYEGYDGGGIDRPPTSCTQDWHPENGRKERQQQAKHEKG